MSLPYVDSGVVIEPVQRHGSHALAPRTRPTSVGHQTYAMHRLITCPYQAYLEAHNAPCSPALTLLTPSLPLYLTHSPPATMASSWHSWILSSSVSLQISPTSYLLWFLVVSFHCPYYALNGIVFDPFCAACLPYCNRSSKNVGALLCLLSTAPIASRTVSGIQQCMTICVFGRTRQLCCVLLEAPEGSLIATWFVKLHHLAASLGRVADTFELDWVSQAAQIHLWKSHIIQ